MAVRSAFWTAFWFGVIVGASDIFHAIGPERIVGFFSSHVSVYFEHNGLSFESQHAVTGYLGNIQERFIAKISWFLEGILITSAVLLISYDSFRFPRFIGRMCVRILRNTPAVYTFMASMLFAVTTARSGDRYFVFRFAFVFWLVWIFLYALASSSVVLGYVAKIAVVISRWGRVFLRNHQSFNECLSICKRPHVDPLFLPDRALGEDGEERKDRKSAVDQDELGMKDDAKRFAEDVLNNGSDSPMVFGIDAPWGSGKSSYLALCEEQVWDKQQDVVVFHFNPTLYDLKRQDLFDVFSGELVATLRKSGVHMRSFRARLRKLSRLFSGSSLSFPGFSVPFHGFGSETVDTLKKRLEGDIRRSGRRIIAIIDDLDRLYLEDVKDMLGIVRNVLDIRGMSCILCYDSESVNSFESDRKTVHRHTQKNEGDKNSFEYFRESHEPDNQSINAYFEKMVQVKKTLIPGREELNVFFRKEITKIFGEFGRKEGFKKAVDYFFEQERYPIFQPYLGDIRKIKRLVNVIRSLHERINRSGKSIDTIDIHEIGLIQLLLIYINLPQRFREVFFAEDNDSGHGIFSFSRESSNNSEYKEEYKKYLSKLNGYERKIFERIFGKPVLDSGERASQTMKRELFFSGDRGELYRHLLLIMQLDKIPPAYENHSFVDIQLKTFKESEGSLADYFRSVPEFEASLGESPRDYFFRLSLSSSELDESTADNMCDYIVQDLKSYSMVDDFLGVYHGIRNRLIYWLIALLDKYGWPGSPVENNNVNVSHIARRILGESEYAEKGVFEQLLGSSRGVLGVHDASVLLLSCKRKKQGDFNLKRSLELYGGEDKLAAARKMSQMFFTEFKSRYIDSGKNFFAVVENLAEAELFGDFSEAIRKAFVEKGMSADEELARIRVSIAGHLVWQLASGSSETAGFHDPEGTADGGGISQAVRQYLFDVCFDVDSTTGSAEKNARLFVNYMLAGFEHDYSNSSRDDYWAPMAKKYAEILGEEELTKYWAKNRERIRKMSQKWNPETKVHTYNYIAIYRDDLEPLFKELDTLTV
ncbi:MAG: hypothetical protein HGA33_02225 [Candidatus Moranbacteria bacterium]|nr:hypothetical protein [Candidatus Moranbacteria bacterium]